MLHMQLLKCFDKYQETPESRESVDQKWDGDDSASPRVTPRAPTPFGRAPEGTHVFIYTSKYVHISAKRHNLSIKMNLPTCFSGKSPSSEKRE